MKKTDAKTMRDILTKWKERNDQFIRSLFAPMPSISLHIDMYALVNDLLGVEEISEDLQKEIGRILGENWMRRKDENS